MVLKEFDLKGKMAIVTGASRGLGKAIALTLAEAGADIVAAARTVPQLEETAGEVECLGRRCLPVPLDIRQADQVRQMMERAHAEFGRIDILVNNAGIGIPKAVVPLPRLTTRTTERLEDFDKPISEEEWYRVLDTDLKGPFLCTQAVGPYMMEQRRGKVINVSSINAERAEPYHSLYCISKSGLSMFTRVMALEWARFNINVNAIGPGRFRTGMSERQHDDPQLRERMLRDIPLRRTGELREVGLLAVYLASPASDYMTGQTIFLDGGFLVL